MIGVVGGGKKSGKNFFLTWQKLRENVAEKCGEVIEKSWQKKLVKNITFLQRQQINQSDEECSWECCCEMIDNREINNEFAKSQFS